MTGNYEDIKQMDREILAAKALRDHRATCYKNELILKIVAGTIDPVRALFIWMEHLPPLNPKEPKNLSLYPFNPNERIPEEDCEYDLVEFLTCDQFLWWYDLTGISLNTDLIDRARIRLLFSLNLFTLSRCEGEELEYRLRRLVIELMSVDTFTGYYSNI